MSLENSVPQIVVDVVTRANAKDAPVWMRANSRMTLESIIKYATDGLRASNKLEDDIVRSRKK